MSTFFNNIFDDVTFNVKKFKNTLFYKSQFLERIGTYVDMGTCPHHIWEQSLENLLFLNFVSTKYKT